MVTVPQNREPTRADTVVASLQERVTNLDGERLPSEMVGNPKAPGSGWYASIVAMILWIGLAALDTCAWFWYFWDLGAAILGRQPPRCTVRCRCVVDNTVSPRILCAKQCCLPADHGPTFQHCCRTHLKYGGSLSREVMDSWEVFSWGHGVLRKARRLWASTYRLMSK